MYLIVKTFETQALVYQSLKCYDSVIVWVDSLQANSRSNYYDNMMKARAYQHLNQTDSALFYAKAVVASSHSNSCAIAAYYILSHLDTTISGDSILTLTSSRADAQKRWAYSQAAFSQAVQILEQDLTREPDWKWLMGIIGTLVVIGSIIGLYVYRKGKQKALLSQKIDILEQTANRIQEKKDELAERYQNEQQRIEAEIEEKCVLLKNDDSLTKTLAWNDFEAMCHIVDKQFYLLASKLRNMDALNDTEIRLCVLVLINLNRKQIALTLPYALNSVGKLKDHTAKMLGSTGKNLRNFLLKMITQG